MLISFKIVNLSYQIKHFHVHIGARTIPSIKLEFVFNGTLSELIFLNSILISCYHHILVRLLSHTGTSVIITYWYVCYHILVRLLSHTGTSVIITYWYVCYHILVRLLSSHTGTFVIITYWYVCYHHILVRLLSSHTGTSVITYWYVC